MTAKKTAGRAAPAAAPAPPTTTSAPTAVTSAAQIGAGFLVRLPGTGYVVRLRKPGPRALLASGLVPNALADKVYQAVRPRDAGAPEPTEDDRRRMFIERQEAIAFVVSQCFIEPRLVIDREPDYAAGEIGRHDLNDVDYLFVYYDWAEGSRETAAPFLVAEGA